MENKSGKVTASAIWVVLEKFSNQGITLVLTIILARLLTPEDYGLIGVISILTSVASVIASGGFSDALIRRDKISEGEYTAVQVTNVTFAFIVYLVVYFSSGFIAEYFARPELENLLKVGGVSIIFSSLSLIFNVKIIREINFKKLSVVNLIANISSGVVAVYFASNKYGVWSLIIRQVGFAGLTTLLLTFIVGIRLTAKVQWRIIPEIFGFSYRMLATMLLYEAFENLNKIFIGKYFPIKSLGLYTRAQQFQEIFSRSISLSIISVFYPALSKYKDDLEHLKRVYRKMYKVITMITFSILFFLISSAENFVMFILGDKWQSITLILRLFCIIGLIRPLVALNMNILKVNGEAKLILRNQIYMTLASLLSLGIGYKFGLEYLLCTMIVIIFMSLIYLSTETHKIIRYSFIEQILDVKSSFIRIAFCSIPIYVLDLFYYSTTTFLMQLILYPCSLLLVFELSKLSPYLEVKNAIFKKLKIKTTNTFEEKIV